MTTLSTPTWMPDDASDKCLVCANSFGLLSSWKHHCRLCGQLVCSNCLGLAEVKHMYFTGPHTVQESYIPPLSKLRIISHPNASSTRVQLSQWLPGSLAKHTHLDPRAPKVCGPCGVRLAKERQSWVFARAIAKSLPLLSEYRQRVLFREALNQYHAYCKDPSASNWNELATLGQWVHLLGSFKFYLHNVQNLNQYPFIRQLMAIIYAQWYDYIDQQKDLPSNTETHTILTLLLNLVDKHAPTMGMSKLRLLLQDTMNATHLLVGHQILNYSTRVQTRVIEECWSRLFAETESLALFMHNRLCCEALCMSKQTNTSQDQPTNGMFRAFFEFLEKRLQGVTATRNPPTYVQTVCALMHNTVYCQPRLAQGCAHVLHVDIDTVHTFYAQCFDNLWNLTHGTTVPHKNITNVFDDYDATIPIMNVASSCATTLSPQEVLKDANSSARVMKVGLLLVVPIARPRFSYAIQHVTRLFFRTQITDPVGSSMSETEDRAHGMCSSLHLFFGPESFQKGRMGNTLGYLNASVLKLGQLKLVTHHEEWSVSILTYVILYFILTLHDAIGSKEEEAREKLDKTGLPLVATIDRQSTPFLVMPYTLRACHAVRAHLCTTPLTDTVLAEVQRVSTLFITTYLPELWMAFLPLAQAHPDGESKLRAYFRDLVRVNDTDTFRSSFLNLVF